MGIHEDEMIESLSKEVETLQALHPDLYLKLAERTSATGTREGRQECLDRFNRVGHFLIRIMHGQMGLATEIGEFLDPIKRYIFYGTPFDEVNLKEELGDLEWYFAEIYNALKELRSIVQKRNVDKLRVRFPERFTNEKAVNRDLDTERKVLEGADTEVKESCPCCGGLGQAVFMHLPECKNPTRISCSMCEGTGIQKKEAWVGWHETLGHLHKQSDNQYLGIIAGKDVCHIFVAKEENYPKVGNRWMDGTGWYYQVRIDGSMTEPSGPFPNKEEAMWCAAALLDAVAQNQKV